MVQTTRKTFAFRIVFLLACGVSVALFWGGRNAQSFLNNSAVAEDKPAASTEKKPESPAAKPAESAPKLVPINLKPYVNMKAENFEKNTVYPWKIVPSGAQTYANIPLKIDGTIMLWGEVNTKRGMVFREHVVGIPVKQTLETLYVYHGSFFEGTSGEAVYDIMFHYADGSSAFETIFNGLDVRDWYGNREEETFGPTGERSVLAWDGDHVNGDKKQAIRFCLTAVENPYPKLEVTSIDLVSSKKRTAGCILAMSYGKSGLMRLTPEKKPGADSAKPEEAKPESAKPKAGK